LGELLSADVRLRGVILLCEESEEEHRQVKVVLNGARITWKLVVAEKQRAEDKRPEVLVAAE
jgi:hypothetical protein